MQKVPRLLDVVHQLIESTPLHFALTGSSARKLKRGGANLLAGRAFVYHMFPLTHVELGERFDLSDALHWGTLPKTTHLQTVDEKITFLRSYALTYLKEEIQAEQIVRRLDPFRRFLEVAAQCNGEIVNFTKVGREVGVDTKTAQSFFQILEDTLVGFLLEPFHTSMRKRLRHGPKFYFLDPGVKRALERTLTGTLLPQTYAYGKAFEHFLVLEIMRLAAYRYPDYRFSYLRTKDDAEIDLVIERPGQPLVLIEMKSRLQVNEQDVRSVAAFLKDCPHAVGFCFSLDPLPKRFGAVDALYWRDGLKALSLLPE